MSFMEYTSTAPLTLANLALPQFQAQNTCRVELFVRSQRLHASTFASGGRTFDEHISSSEKPSLPSAKIQGVGFSSPVLKARVDKIQDTAAASILAEESSNASSDGEAGKRSIYQVAKGDPLTRRTCKKGSKKIPTTRPRPAAKPNAEHAARLAERRNRRRAKRAILNPVFTSNTTKDESSGEVDKKSKRTEPKKKKAKIDPELTLMQSFSASNIGKERLTLKPGPGLGVFNKGKASILMWTDGGKRRRKKDHTFSESKFLKRATPQDTLSELEILSSSSSSCASKNSHTLDEPKISKFFTKTPRSSQNRSHDKDTRTGSEKKPCAEKDVHVKGLEIQAGPLADDRGSEVWDIELDKSLPSNDKSLSDQDLETQNVVLKTHFNKLAVTNPPGINPNDEMQFSTRGHSLPRSSSPIHEQSSVLGYCKPPSLAPSHSASRLFNPQHYGYDMESIIQQPETNQTENECFPLSHAAPTFRFRPMRDANHTIISPAIQSPLIPMYNKEDEVSTQALPDMLLLDPRVMDDESNFNRTGNKIINDHDYPEQHSHDMMDVYLDDYTSDDDGVCRWSQDGSNQDLDPAHEIQETTTDLIYQHELGIFEDDWEDGEDWDGQDAVLFEKAGWSGSFNTGEWSAIPMDDAGGYLGVDAHTSHSVENWSEVDDFRAMSLSGSPAYTQEARGTDPAQASSFNQGRSLLFGIEDPIVHNEEVLWGVESAEHEVTARLLKDHWLPQKL